MNAIEKNRDIWYNLDNAANIFPAVSDDKNTNVFRISCELKENIDRVLLQKALDSAMKSFGYFQVVMRRGLFWFYLERTTRTAKVAFETQRPCSRMFYKNRKELLFAVTYYRNRINLEVFHSVSDGTGAMQLLRSIAYEYILLAHRDSLPALLPPLDQQSPPAVKAEDSFAHHYNPEQKSSPFRKKAYTIGGTQLPWNSMKIITGVCPTKQLIALAKSKSVTITAYLAAMLICAVYTELMPAHAKKRPIGITIPVDLRKHFPSETARNFFSVVDVVYQFDGGAPDFDAVLESATEQLAEKLKPGALAGRMNYTTGVQKNIFARAVPLILKNFVLKAAYVKGEKATTCALSNLGRVTMPDVFSEYISGFSALLNPTPIHKVKATVCSFGDNMVITFTSCIAETKVQRYFFRHLAKNGVNICITCNGGDDDEIL